MTVDSSSESEKVAASTWNKAGTWEERDMSSFVKDKLNLICNPTTAEIGADKVVVTSATSEGDAQIVLARSKKRHIYDFNVVVEFEVSLVDSEGKTKKFKGSQTFPEVSPISSYESTITFKKSIPPELKARVDGLVGSLKNNLVENFRRFDFDYKQM